MTGKPDTKVRLLSIRTDLTRLATAKPGTAHQCRAEQPSCGRKWNRSSCRKRHAVVTMTASRIAAENQRVVAGAEIAEHQTDGATGAAYAV